VISRTKPIGRIVGIAGILSIVLVLAVAPTAFADDTITLTPATQSVEYGQSWSILGNIPGEAPCANCSPGTLTMTTGSTTRTLPGYTEYQGSFGFGDYNLMPQTNLGVGTHLISFSYAPNSGGSATTAAPVKVTITPAVVSVSTTIIDDPNSGTNAIVSAQLSGNFIDQLPGCYCEDAGLYPLPAGTWNLKVTDARGSVILSKQQQQAADGQPFFVSYWPNVPAGESFSAEATYTVATASSANFTMTPHKFAWTSAKATTGKAVITGSGSPKTKPTALNTGFAPPLWLLLLVLVVAVLILTLDIVLLARRFAPPRVAEVVGESVR
jgi:hypothetical protein